MLKRLTQVKRIRQGRNPENGLPNNIREYTKTYRKGAPQGSKNVCVGELSFHARLCDLGHDQCMLTRGVRLTYGREVCFCRLGYDYHDYHDYHASCSCSRSYRYHSPSSSSSLLLLLRFVLVLVVFGLICHDFNVTVLHSGSSCPQAGMSPDRIESLHGGIQRETEEATAPPFFSDFFFITL